MTRIALEPAGEDTGPVAEFIALRAEIERIASQQWNVLALQITIAGAIFGFSLSGPNRELLLLIIPVSTYMLCGRYVLHTYGIRRIATYIRTSLSPRVPGGLGWEDWKLKNANNHYVGHFRIAHPAGITFPGISALAIAAFILSTLNNGAFSGKPWYVLAGVAAVTAADAVLTIVIAVSTWKARTTR